MKIINKHFSSIFYIILINLIIISNIKLNTPIINDFYSFHEGEYLGLLWDILDFKNNNKNFPIIIHGMMDFIPQLIAYYFGSADYLIINTRIINLIILNLTYTGFFLIIVEVTKDIKNREFLLLFSFILIYQLAILINTSLYASMSFLGLREFLIIYMIYFTIKSYYCKNNLKKFITLFLPVIFVLSLFWAYNRAPFSIILFTIYNLYLIKIKFYKNIFYNIFIVLFLFYLLDFINITGSIIEHLNNFLYFLKYGSELWYRPNLYKPRTIEYLILFYITILCVLNLVQSFKIKKLNFFIQSMVLIAFNLLMAKIILTRPGGLNSHWFFWPMILLTLNYLITIDLSLFSQLNDFIIKITNNKLVFLLIFSIFMIVNFNSNFISGLSKTRKSIINKYEDTYLVNKYYNININTLNQLDLNCYFLFTSDGIFSLLSKKPSCTDFPYSAQIANNKQEEIIQSLKTNNPDIIIMETPTGVKTIDSISIFEKTRKIHNFVKKNYPFESKFNEFVFRSKEPVFENSYSSGELLFTTKNNFKNYLKQGLSSSEKNYAWSTGEITEFNFSLFKNTESSNYVLKFLAEPFLVPKKLEKQIFEVYFNEEFINRFDLSINDEFKMQSIPIPKKYTEKIANPSQKLQIKFKYLNATSPADLQISSDTRKLALKFKSLELVKN